MSELLPCVEIEPAGEPLGGVLWLHGLGASGHDFEDLVPLLGLPQVRFVFPHAPRRPVTINQGLIMPAWYDIEFLGGSGGGENAGHVRDSAGLIRALLAREERRGVASSRIVLAGFSQGGALALYVGDRHPEPLLGVMVLSACELLPHTREAEASPASATTAMLFCHGTHDPLVSVERGRRAYEAHATPGRPIEWREFPMGHQVCAEEVGVIRDWLRARFDAAQ
jgi:phospholipase/carboxylesterase